MEIDACAWPRINKYISLKQISAKHDSDDAELFYNLLFLPNAGKYQQMNDLECQNKSQFVQQIRQKKTVNQNTRCTIRNVSCL